MTVMDWWFERYGKKFKLSKENYDKLNEHFLYYYKYAVDLNNNIPAFEAEPYRNYTYFLVKHNGRALMIDTRRNSKKYNPSKAFIVTDDNINLFVAALDLREYETVHSCYIKEYDRSKLIKLCVNPWGYEGDDEDNYTFWKHIDLYPTSVEAIKELNRNKVIKLEKELLKAEKELAELKMMAEKQKRERMNI